MFLISQVEYSIGYLKNIVVNETLENSLSSLFLIKSIKPLNYSHKTMIYFIFFPFKIRIYTIVSVAFLLRF